MSREFDRTSLCRGWLLGVVVVLAATIGLAACDRVPKAEQVIVVKGIKEDGWFSVASRGSIERNPVTGKLEPDYRKPGTLYLFRLSTDKVGEVAAEAGEIYQVQPDKTLKKVGAFDLAQSDDDLIKRYAKK